MLKLWYGANHLIRDSLNFNVICPKTWKSGLIMSQLHKAKLICSSVIFYNNEVKNLRIMFLHNGYGKHFVDVMVKSLKL